VRATPVEALVKAAESALALLPIISDIAAANEVDGYPSRRDVRRMRTADATCLKCLSPAIVYLELSADEDEDDDDVDGEKFVALSIVSSLPAPSTARRWR